MKRQGREMRKPGLAAQERETMKWSAEGVEYVAPSGRGRKLGLAIQGRRFALPLAIPFHAFSAKTEACA
jgi:hypothetical protein